MQSQLLLKQLRSILSRVSNVKYERSRTVQMSLECGCSTKRQNCSPGRRSD